MRKAERLTPHQLDWARTRFQEYEPRDLFYRVSTQLIKDSLADPGSLTLTECLCVLLFTWNQQWFRFHPDKRSARWISEMERLVEERRPIFQALRQRSLLDADPQTQLQMVDLFIEVHALAGPVGAAKTLHLLAPEMFPLWDRQIADRGYGLPVDPSGYAALVRTMKWQAEELIGQGAKQTGLLKRIDEWNYCVHSRRWSESKT